MMSEKWGGFSDEDIERIKSNSSEMKSCNDKICELDGVASTVKTRGPMKIKKALLKSPRSESSDDGLEDNPISNSKETKESACKRPDAYQTSNTRVDSSGEDEPCTCNSYDIFEENRNERPPSSNDPEYEDISPSSASLPPLEMFEMRQKRIEAENARRRALINKAINDKKLRTHAEAVKLAKITQELNRIDSNLSADVSILRDYIEKASQEFSEAEKRYLKAEKEFVEAKLILFEKMQRKEMLTEHLCAIIEQSENRKADKLVELMKQLEMEVIIEDCEVNGIQPILPNLCALNEEPYYNCQTIKPALSKSSSQEKSVDEISQVSEADQDKPVELPNDIPTEDNVPNGDKNCVSEVENNI